jgi:hypothetical protein
MEKRLARTPLGRLPASAAAAAAATAIATAASTTTTAAAGCAAFCLGARFVHIESAASHLVSIQGRDRLFAVFGIRHFDEAKTARTAGVAVRHDRHSIDLSILFEQLAELIFPSVETEIPNEDIFHAKASVPELFESGCLRREREKAKPLVVGRANSSNADEV